jgi:hypothetical protein
MYATHLATARSSPECRHAILPRKSEHTVRVLSRHPHGLSRVRHLLHRFSILEWMVDEAFDIFTIFHIWFWRRPMVWYLKIVERDMTTNNPLKSLIFWISVIASFPVSHSNCQAAAASHEGGNVPPFDFWGNMTIQWDLLMATMIGN